MLCVEGVIFGWVCLLWLLAGEAEESGEEAAVPILILIWTGNRNVVF